MHSGLTPSFLRWRFAFASVLSSLCVHCARQEASNAADGLDGGPSNLQAATTGSGRARRERKQRQKERDALKAVGLPVPEALAKRGERRSPSL